MCSISAPRVGTSSIITYLVIRLVIRLHHDPQYHFLSHHVGLSLQTSHTIKLPSTLYFWRTSIMYRYYNVVLVNIHCEYVNQ